jgi:hypothetical protein
VYVNDIIFIAPIHKYYNFICEQIAKYYKLKDMRETAWNFHLIITRVNRNKEITQK